jgi:hypothetical protein
MYWISPLAVSIASVDTSLRIESAAHIFLHFHSQAADRNMENLSRSGAIALAVFHGRDDVVSLDFGESHSKSVVWHVGTSCMMPPPQ